MTDVARRLLAPLLSIAAAEGVPTAILSLPGEDRSSLRLAELLTSAQRLEDAVGGSLALIDAATSVRAWPEIAVFARAAGGPYELALVLWESILTNDLPSMIQTWEDRGPDHFEIRARLPAPATLRTALGSLLAGAVRAVPLFYDLGPAHVQIAWEEDTLALAVTLPPYEGFVCAPPSERLGRRDTIDAVVGLLDDRARYQQRRADTSSAARALGEGLATAKTSEDAAALTIDVLTTHLGFSQALLWAGPTPRARGLLASAGERLEPTRVLPIPDGALPCGLLEVDAGGDIPFVETLLPWIGGDLARRLRAEQQRAIASAPLPDRWNLTARQGQVAGLIADGLANKEIAVALRCSTATVEDHLTAIYRKVGVSGRGPLLAILLGARST